MTVARSKDSRSDFGDPALQGAGVALRRTLAVALPIRFLARDGPGIAALTVWSLLYVWVGLRLGAARSPRPARDAAPAAL
jgi:hypothetical protein